MTRMKRGNALRAVEEARERGVRPDLRGVDLSYAYLCGADLAEADLVGANLTDADLQGADLFGADLRHSDLISAHLQEADLQGENLDGANLQEADLICANLTGVDLSYANLADTWWDGLAIDGLHPCRILLLPTPGGWRMTVGCWSGTPDELRVLIAQDDGWPEARGGEITRRRPLLEAALHVVDAHIAGHPDVIDELKERWKE